MQILRFHLLRCEVLLLLLGSYFSLLIYLIIFSCQEMSDLKTSDLKTSLWTLGPVVSVTMYKLIGKLIDGVSMKRLFIC